MNPPALLLLSKPTNRLCVYFRKKSPSLHVFQQKLYTCVTTSVGIRRPLTMFFATTSLPTLESLMTQNRLKIRAKSLNLELTGDAEYIADAYEAIREVLMQRFRAALRNDDAETTATNHHLHKRRNTKPLYTQPSVQTHLGVRPAIADANLRLIVCDDLYHKVSALSRPDFQASIFSRSLDIQQVEHVYIDAADADLLSQHLDVGKTLWRELTAAGRFMVHGNSS